jgi:transposase
MSVSFVARKHGFSPSLLFKEAADGRGGREAVRVDDEVIGASRVRQFEERIRELERLLGRKTLEVEILKEALAAAGKKTAVALAVAPDEGGSRHAGRGALEPRGTGAARRKPAATAISRAKPRDLGCD